MENLSRLKEWVMYEPHRASDSTETHILPMGLFILLLAKTSAYLCICAWPLLQSSHKESEAEGKEDKHRVPTTV